jgi:hypothetical protein
MSVQSYEHPMAIRYSKYIDNLIEKEEKMISIVLISVVKRNLSIVRDWYYG